MARRVMGAILPLPELFGVWADFEEVGFLGDGLAMEGGADDGLSPGG